VPKYAGRNAAVYISTSGTGVATSLLSATEWSLDLTTGDVDVTDFDSTNKEYIPDWPDRRGTLSGWWRDDEDKLYQAIDSADGCNIYLYPSKLAPGRYFYGPSWISGTVRANVSGAVAFTGAIRPRGPWGRKSS
jgi:hypothetical protein